LAVILGRPITKASDPRLVAALLLFTMTILYCVFR
jgi:hypothetical protein